MKVNKKNLEDALTIVEPGLAKKEMIDQTTSFAFYKDRVVTYNDEISVSHPVKGLNIIGAVKADKLYAFLKKVKTKKDQDDIDIELKDNEILISYRNIKAGLAIQSEIKIPNLELPKTYEELPEGFNDSIKFTMTSCSRDMSRPVITCVHVNKDGYIEASDSFRIARCELKQELPINTFLLPASSAVEVVKFNPIEVGFTKGWAHFRTEEGSVLSCRLVEGEFPDTFPIRKSFTKTPLEIKLPNSLNTMIERAIVFAKRDHVLDEILDVKLENGMFILKAGSDTEWFEEKIGISEYKGPPLSITITPYLLKGILAKEEKTCLYADNKLMFQAENWIYITMLRG